MKIRNLQVVAEADTPEGGSVLINCAIRERDIEPEVLIYLREKAGGMHGSEDQLPDEFDRSDALGG